MFDALSVATYAQKLPTKADSSQKEAAKLGRLSLVSRGKARKWLKLLPM